ncbi:TlpA disulfide reductase family protein [Flavobacterium sp. JAS]|uniref:TlpA family protein disulfide reductase n=1 Tax=Flavobacterium sp. JAS TaxID=2897329 RepID=UPI001E33E64A|nr:TlpA disulfide reductase family protein [Flavobacterium sp. JAS]MCD0472626.1 TlpA family protein disulfide reductase [Flavobacterium sp. JAS]
MSLDIKKGTQFPNIKFVDNNRKSFKIENDKIILFDFWSTKCGICYEKFPDLERLYLKYKDNKDVQIYSVHVPYPQDNFSSTLELIEKLNYKFPTLFAVSKNETMEKLNFNSFPYYIIIQNNKIVYSGFFETDEGIIVGNTEREIDRLLEINK